MTGPVLWPVDDVAKPGPNPVCFRDDILPLFVRDCRGCHGYVGGLNLDDHDHLMAGGQPVSMACVKDVRALCDRHGLKLYLDATRLVESAFFIQEREAGYAERSIAQIVREQCDLTDGAWVSAKKDSLVNIGGWLKD